MREHWELILGILALGAAVWSHIRSFGHWLAGFVVAVRRTDFDTANLILTYLNHIRPGMSREPAYGSSNHWFVRPLNRTARVMYKILVWSGAQVFWWNRRPLRFHRSADEENVLGGHEQTFSFIRGTLDWEALLLEVANWENSIQRSDTVRHRVKYHHGKSFGTELAEASNKKKSRGWGDEDARVWDPYAGMIPLHWRTEDIGGNPCPSSIGDLSLSEELMAIFREIEFWHGSRDWYGNHRIPWRRGYIFHGPPGTGKTSLARATAETLDLPVHVFDLASMSNEDLRRAWTSMAGDVPCMALIEDIDAVFDGRESRAHAGGLMSSGGLTFDCLLNCIDGIERSDGILLMMTTNHRDAIDPALFDRPGRIDRMVEFGPLDHEGRLKLAEQILGVGPEAARIARESGDLPAAKLQELCCRDAIARRFAANDAAPEFGPMKELRKEIIR